MRLPLTTSLRATTPSPATLADQCKGFRLDGVDGRLGTVSGIWVDPLTGEPVALGVRTGLFARRTVTVDIHDISAVDPLAHRVTTTLVDLDGRGAKR